MQVHNSPTSQQSQQLRQFFSTSIRTRQKSSILSQIRLSFLQSYLNSQLNTLIQQTQSPSSPSSSLLQSQWKMLLFYSMQNNYNAQIHIGNLIIDGRLTGSCIWMAELPARAQYGEWLMRISIETGMEGVYEVVARTMTRWASQLEDGEWSEFRIENFVKGFVAYGKRNKRQFGELIIRLLNEKNKLFKLISYCHSTNFQISKHSWKLAGIIFNQQSDQLSLKMLCLFQIKNFFPLIHTGLLSINSHIRSLSCQILTNNIATIFSSVNIGYFPESILPQIQPLIQKILTLLESPKQKHSFKLQSTYFLLNYLQCCSLSSILWLIKNNLLPILSSLKQQQQYEQKNLEMLQNIRKICRFLTNISNEGRFGQGYEAKMGIRAVLQGLYIEGLLTSNEEEEKDDHGDDQMGEQ